MIVRAQCRPQAGDSVAVDGCCLTVVSIDHADPQGPLVFDLSEETLRRTIIGAYQTGTRVNIEESLQLGDRLGGHLVTGHIDETAEVIAAGPDLKIRLSPGAVGLVAEKGSIAINGVSLTVSAWDRDSRIAEAALIPETLARTNLGRLSAGARVNVEYDLIARYVNERIR